MSPFWRRTARLYLAILWFFLSFGAGAYMQRHLGVCPTPQHEGESDERD